MGDFLSSKKNEQTTNNNQVGVSGGGIGISNPTRSAVAVGSSNLAINGGIKAGNASTLNFVMSDQGAIAAGQAIALQALQDNTAVSALATNAALQTSIHSLDVVHSSQENAAALIAQVQAGANEVALRATPVSAGEVATAIVKPLLIGALILGAIILLPRLTK